MAESAGVIRKSAPTRSEIRPGVDCPRTDQRRDGRLHKRTKVLRGSPKTGAERPIRADSERSVTKTEEEIADHEESTFAHLSRSLAFLHVEFRPRKLSQ